MPRARMGPLMTHHSLLVGRVILTELGKGLRPVTLYLFSLA